MGTTGSTAEGTSPAAWTASANVRALRTRGAAGAGVDLPPTARGAGLRAVVDFLAAPCRADVAALLPDEPVAGAFVDAGSTWAGASAAFGRRARDEVLAFFGIT
ncbi:hypothetical protein TBR22_A29410 [Luteitalea sp. TBR-22]|nr:hypothetical protein TBR22_A29410 [Luteitalea sp. TBR-22]